MVCDRVTSAKVVTFADEPDLRLIWFEDSLFYRVDCFWRDSLVWAHRYANNDESFDDTVLRLKDRVKYIVLLMKGQIR